MKFETNVRIKDYEAKDREVYATFAAWSRRMLPVWEENREVFKDALQAAATSWTANTLQVSAVFGRPLEPYTKIPRGVDDFEEMLEKNFRIFFVGERPLANQ